MCQTVRFLVRPGAEASQEADALLFNVLPDMGMKELSYTLNSFCIVTAATSRFKSSHLQRNRIKSIFTDFPSIYPSMRNDKTC